MLTHAGDATVSHRGTTTAVPFHIAGLESGAIFAGRYRLQRSLGAGGMGAVYQAWDNHLGLSIAIKVVRPDVTPDAESARDFEQRFKQELLLARQVSHRNVLRIHDLGETNGVKYITMSYVEGRDLAALLNSGPIPAARARDLARQLASGLAAAHDAGIVHHDLKPQNILIGPGDHLYISDFGLAKSLEASTVGLTRPGEFLGTPRYVAPEQLSGGPLDHRVDIYALGLILYEVLTGAAAFEAPSAIELMMVRVHERPKPPRERVPGIPEDLDAIVMRCLERDPAARYQDAHDIEADLGSGSMSRPATGPVQPRPRSRLSPLLLGAAAILLAAAVTVTFAVRGWLGNRDGTPSAPSTPVLRIAVLPFTVVGDAAALAPIATGVNEALTSKLFALKNVAVSADTAVQRASKKDTPAAIGAEIGANLLVSGSVQGASDRLRITARLKDIAANRDIWSKDVDGVPADLLALEDQLYGDLLQHLPVKATDAEIARMVTHPTENIDAYAAYLKGRQAMRGEQNMANVQAAIADYHEALSKDPNFALAYAGIADSSLRMYRATKEPRWADEALSAAQQADTLDDKLVEVHVALGNVYQATGKTAASVVELQKATELAPNSDDAFRRLGRAYLSTGRGEQAVQAYRRAVAVNPYHWVNSDTLGAALLQLGRYDEAIAAFAKVIELAPNNVNGYNDIGAAYLRTARFPDAIAAFKKALTLQEIPNTYTNLGIAYADAGQFSEAVPMFEKAAAMQPGAEVFAGNLADGYRWAGERQKASAAYDRAIGLALKALQVNPRDANTKGNLALYYAKKGDPTSARRFMSEARGIDRNSADLLYDEAVMSALLGDKDAAFKDLGEALGNGLPLSAIQSDPDLRSLRDDPRFAQLKPVPPQRG